METLQKILKDKAHEHLSALRSFSHTLSKSSDDISKDMELVRVLKKKTKDLTHEDVKDTLVNIMVTSYEQNLMTDQVIKRHLPLFNEIKALALAGGVDLELSEEDNAFLSSLVDEAPMLYIPTKEGVKPKDEETHKRLVSKIVEQSSLEFNLKGCFEGIKTA